MSKGLSAVDLEDMHRLSGSKLPLEIYCYYEGRTNAINECIEIVENEKWNYLIISKLEQLKEQNNDSF